MAQMFKRLVINYVYYVHVVLAQVWGCPKRLPGETHWISWSLSYRCWDPNSGLQLEQQASQLYGQKDIVLKQQLWGLPWKVNCSQSKQPSEAGLRFFHWGWRDGSAAKGLLFQETPVQFTAPTKAAHNGMHLQVQFLGGRTLTDIHAGKMTKHIK